ncbi:MAG: T9SS type A sorting domain-containing protein [Bacteroidota bacterium]
MKTFIQLIIIFTFFSKTTKAQDLPDILSEQTSSAHYYYPNTGQIIDNQNIVRNDILYYTERTQPAVYLANNKAYFIVSKRLLDTSNVDTGVNYISYRIQLDFINNSINQPNLISSENGCDYLNYYLPHCSNGILNVPSYKRVVYQNAFPNIDYHFYSNSSGLKNYIVINPGANPNDILLKFSGQDSIAVIDSAQLQFYLTAGTKFTLPQASAYQIDNSGLPISVNWDPVWVSLGNGYVTLQTKNYNLNLPLVIRIGTLTTDLFGKTKVIGNLHWSTYYGGNSSDQVADLIYDDNKNLYSVGQTYSSSFPTINGQTWVYNNNGDVYISKFDVGSSRNWATYYGGSLKETPQRLALPGSSVCIIGSTISTNLPFPNTNNGVFKQTTHGGGTSDAFIISLTQSGYLDWTTYFGGNGSDWGYSITEDGSGKFYIVGSTASTQFTSSCSPSSGYFPVCNSGYGAGYYQNWNNGNFDAFVAEFNSDKSLNWSTLFGGNLDEDAYDIIAPKYSSNLIICGRTLTYKVPSNIASPIAPPNNGSFPISDPGSSAYVQTYRNPINNLPFDDAFIAKFDYNRNLEWSTFFGGDGYERATSLAVNYYGDIYLSGVTSTNQSQTGCTANNLGKIPICNSNGKSYIQTTYGGGDQDQFIAKFNSIGVLEWSTYYGGGNNEGKYFAPYISHSANIAINSHYLFGKNAYHDDIVYFSCYNGSNNPLSSSSSGGISTFQLTKAYYQDYNSSDADPVLFNDGYLLAFNSYNSRIWATYFGGGSSNITGNTGDEYIYSLAITNSSDNGILAIGGRTFTPNTTPYQCPPQTTSTPFCDNTINGNDNGFITTFDMPSVQLAVKNWVGIDKNFKIYPNPANDILNIEIPFREIGDAIIKIYDVEGKLIMNTTISGQFGIEKNTINISSLNHGFYFINITNDASYSAKFVK